MTPRERVATAMSLKAADRVPVFCQLALGHYFLNAGLPAHRIWFTSEGFAEALVTMQRRYKFDGLLINLPGRPPKMLDDYLRRIEKTADGELLFWKNDEVTFVPEDDNPRHYSGANNEPTRRADFATIDPDNLNVSNLSGYWWNTLHVPWLDGADPGRIVTDVPDYFLDTIRHVQRETHGQVSVQGEVFSPFTHYMELFGYENALMALIDDPGKVHAIMGRLTESSLAWATAQAKAGVDAVLISSAFAGGGFLSRDMYAEFVLPYERRLADAVRAAGKPVYTHTCGNIGDRVDLMVETHINGLDTMDPPPLGDADLATVKHDVGGQIFLKGNMNSVKLLAAKTPDEVAAEARRCLHAARDRGGYILSTACSVAPRVQPWKLEMLVPLAEESGSYRG